MVISIIGVLSSVVLAGVTSARNKAKDAALKQGVREYVKLMEMNINEYKTNDNLLADGNVINTQAGCNSFFSGTYASEARKICSSIVKNAGSGGLYIYDSLDTDERYSIMVSLNATSNWFCQGSSGVSDNAVYYTDSTGKSYGQVGFNAALTPKGCYFNP